MNAKELLSIIVLNARIGPDASMGGTTDCYHVPLDDIDAAREFLELKSALKCCVNGDDCTEESCTLDPDYDGLVADCMYAKKIKRRDECEYWRIPKNDSNSQH